jgi:replication-associated recombination protein RarA
MNDVALHATTAEQLERFIDEPSHAVMLSGTPGIGKSYLAQYLANRLLHHRYTSLAEHPYVRIIAPMDGKAIGIEPIRELEHFLSLKVPGTGTLKRVIIIQDSQLLGVEAQNALLKTLEEPPADTVIIMTAPSPQSLLPTIQSRMQAITVIKPAKADLNQVMPADSFDSNYVISGGLPGLLHAMLNNKEHPLVAAVATARQLLGQSNYERLIQVDSLAKDKQLAMDTLHILQQMAHISLQTAQEPASKRWQTILSASYMAAEAMDASGNPKLVLTNLMLTL